MLVSGALTFTMIYAAFSPTQALQSAFGESLEGPVANIVVRNWGALIALVGAMLVYGAFRPAVRPLVLVIAGVSKITFISLVLTSGRQFMSHQAGISIAVDSVMVLLFACYFLGKPHERAVVQEQHRADLPKTSTRGWKP
jgi:hypothetical protein